MIAKASSAGRMDALINALDSFRCSKDTDIETFLRFDALRYLERGWCSIYLILNKEDFAAGDITIEAYFTLSHKVLVPCSASKSKVKDAGGFKDATLIHFVLIGHLGKYINESDNSVIKSSSVSATEILDYAFEIIRASSSLIPCRCVLVECSAEEKVHRIYKTYGFKYFQYDSGHYQFYKRI